MCPAETEDGLVRVRCQAGMWRRTRERGYRRGWIRGENRLSNPTLGFGLHSQFMPLFLRWPPRAARLRRGHSHPQGLQPKGCELHRLAAFYFDGAGAELAEFTFRPEHGSFTPSAISSGNGQTVWTEGSLEGLGRVLQGLILAAPYKLTRVKRRKMRPCNSLRKYR